MSKISLSTVMTICILLLTSSVLYARIGSVYGFVVDKFTKKPVSMAKVCLTLSGTPICKNTYPDGAYILNTLAGSNYVLTISATGYRTFESSPINVPSGGYINLPAQLSPIISPTRISPKRQLGGEAVIEQRSTDRQRILQPMQAEEYKKRTYIRK